MLLSRSKQKIVAGLWFVLALLIIGGASSPLFGQSNSQDPEVANGEQILVLKNGQMLIGRIEQDAAHLIVHVRQGSRLVISKNKAEFVCDSKSEAFWGKSARARASDVGQQVELFRWCLKHKLFEHAESQLNIVMNCDISAAELDSLSRQLTVMRASQARQEQRQLAAATRVKQPSVADLDPMSKRLPETVQGELMAGTMVDGQVQQASFVAPMRQTDGSTSPARTPLKSSEGGFSKVAAIPDLQQSHRLNAVTSVTVDPYDVSGFNAETARRNALK